MERLLIWRGTEEWLAEAASVELTASGIRARGTQLGSDPVPYRQRYEHVRATGGGAVVRFVSLGSDAGFSSELELDGDGLVRVYPGLAERVGV